jgi:hypothetical protein
LGKEGAVALAMPVNIVLNQHTDITSMRLYDNRRLARSLLDYMAGPLFQPDVPVSEQALATLLK